MQGPSRHMRGHSHGRVFDGRTAVPHPVTLGVLGNGLQIYGQRARAFGFWSFTAAMIAGGPRARAGKGRLDAGAGGGIRSLRIQSDNSP